MVKRKYFPIPCIVCETIFTPADEDNRYCSRSCYFKIRRKSILSEDGLTKKCVCCGDMSPVEEMKSPTTKRIYTKCFECRSKYYKKRYEDPSPEKREHWNKISRNNRIKSPEKCLLYAARNRAKTQKVPFSIQESDIVIPKFCPILGIPIFRSTGRPTNNSPTVDKVIPEKGYVPGNIAVISYRANVIKNDATEQEHLSVVEYIRKFTKL